MLISYLVSRNVLTIHCGTVSPHCASLYIRLNSVTAEIQMPAKKLKFRILAALDSPLKPAIIVLYRNQIWVSGFLPMTKNHSLIDPIIDTRQYSPFSLYLCYWLLSD
jgi:hypothetical protein